MSKRVLVVGGAGYIGSHVAGLLAERGFEPVILDNMESGHPWALRGPLLKGSTLDLGFLRSVAREVFPIAVMHFAAHIQVPESVEKPGKYLMNNVMGTVNLLEVFGDLPFVFSSSAAVYGEPREVPIPEDAPTLPNNPYGETKLMAERALWAWREARGLRFAALRYFNAAGAWPREGLGECHRPETHLVPRVLLALMRDQEFTVFGGSYPTRDGSALRDLIHVLDLAEAHLLALAALLDGEHLGSLNLGSGNGVTVLEVARLAERVVGRRLRLRVAGPRPGDPARLVARVERAVRVLGWRPKRDLETILRDAWEFYARYPDRTPD